MQTVFTFLAGISGLLAHGGQLYVGNLLAWHDAQMYPQGLLQSHSQWCFSACQEAVQALQAIQRSLEHIQVWQIVGWCQRRFASWTWRWFYRRFCSGNVAPRHCPRCWKGPWWLLCHRLQSYAAAKDRLDCMKRHPNFIWTSVIIQYIPNWHSRNDPRYL